MVRTTESLKRSLSVLAEREKAFAQVLDTHGHPQPRASEPGVETLLRTIVGQQVSVAAARSMWNKLTAKFGQPVDLQKLLDASDEEMREAGMSRQKAGYLRSLAGLVLVRQRPGTAKDVVFVTIEDESGIANLVIWPKVFEVHRRIVMGARLLGVRGRVQREGLVIHLVAEEMWDWSVQLDRIAEIDEFKIEFGRGDQVRTDRADPRVNVPEAPASATHPRKVRSGLRADYDRSRIVLDRPAIRIHSRDFH